MNNKDINNIVKKIDKDTTSQITLKYGRKQCNTDTGYAIEGVQFLANIIKEKLAKEHCVNCEHFMICKVGGTRDITICSLDREEIDFFGDGGKKCIAAIVITNPQKEYCDKFVLRKEK